MSGVELEKLEELYNVDKVFQQLHVGEIDKLLRRLENERKQLKRELGSLVGANYTKILEASSAVDDMKETASSIQALLEQVSFLDKAITGPSLQDGEKKVDDHDENQADNDNDDGFEEGDLMLLEDLWNQIQDGQYEKVAKLLTEETLVNLQSTEFKQCAVITQRLCERILLNVETKKIDTSKIVAIKALGLLTGVPLTELVERSIGPKDINSADVLHRSVSTIMDLSVQIDIDTDRLLRDVLSKTRITGADLLAAAIKIKEGTNSEMGELLFNNWLNSLVDCDFSSEKSIFELCHQLARLSDKPLPLEWAERLKREINFTPLAESLLLYAPLFGYRKSSASTTTTAATIDVDPKENEKLFAAIGLPLVVKL